MGTRSNTVGTRLYSLDAKGCGGNGIFSGVDPFGGKECATVCGGYEEGYEGCRVEEPACGLPVMEYSSCFNFS